MGYDQHGWASPDLILMMRSFFVQETNGGLIPLGGLLENWMITGEVLEFGPTLTAFGTISIEAEVREDVINVSWQATWHTEQPVCVVKIPGWPEVPVKDKESSVTIFREQSGR